MQRFWLSAITLLLSVCVWVPAKADKIEGAFGIVLGQVFGDANDTKPVDGYRFDVDGARTIRYAFLPKSPTPPFTRHYVFITPETKQVFAIEAHGDPRDFCDKKRTAVLETLKQKYGKPKLDERKNIVFVQESREIVLHGCEWNYSIEIVYIDTILLRKYRSEHDRIQRNQADQEKSLINPSNF